MSEPIHAGLFFLLNTLFDLYLFILTLRLMLAFVGANYFDPVTQFIIKLTDFLVKPLRSLIPNIKRLETATLVIILLFESLKFFLISTLTIGFPTVYGVIILSMGDAIKFIIQIYFYAILLQVIISWVQPAAPINRLLYQLISPIMRPLQRCIPPIGGLDITPIPALIILQLLLIMIVSPLLNIGWSAALG